MREAWDGTSMSRRLAKQNGGPGEASPWCGRDTWGSMLPVLMIWLAFYVTAIAGSFTAPTTPDTTSTTVAMHAAPPAQTP